MLDSVLEFITQAASSSAFIFCFCNLIIVIILVDLKPSLSIHQESEIPLSKVANQKLGANKGKDTTSLPQAVEVSHEQEVEAVESIEIEGKDDSNNEEEDKMVEEKEEDHDDNDDDDDDDDEDEDELKRRVEEFIEKVNKGWKEELLSTSSLV